MSDPTTERPRVRKALIPAAGRGTRFLPLTKTVAKELAPIVTTPAIELVVAEASRHGVDDVLLVLSAEKQAVAKYFEPHEELEAALEAKGDKKALAKVRRATELAHIHQVDQGAPKGLGHAVGCGAEFAAGEPILVLLPDDVIDERDPLLATMIETYQEHGGIVIGLIDVPRADIDKYGSVRLADGADPDSAVVPIVELVEKPKPEEAPSTLAVIGRYLLPPEIFETIATTEPGRGGEIQLTDAMQTLARAGVPTHGVVFRGRRYDTGNGLDYMKAVVQLAEQHPEIGDEFSAWLREYVGGTR